METTTHERKINSRSLILFRYIRSMTLENVRSHVGTVATGKTLSEYFFKSSRKGLCWNPTPV